jgi:hypothetical protein
LGNALFARFQIVKFRLQLFVLSRQIVHRHSMFASQVVQTGYLTVYFYESFRADLQAVQVLPHVGDSLFYLDARTRDQL